MMAYVRAKQSRIYAPLSYFVLKFIPAPFTWDANPSMHKSF